MLSTAGDMLSSKKVLTAFVAVAVALGAHFGLHLDPELTATLLGVFAVLIHAQGQADHGKEAAKVNQATAIAIGGLPANLPALV